MEKLISIIIPHYNCPEKLRRLLSSIPSDDRLEVIVVDDKSTNVSKELFLEIEHSIIARNGYFLHNETSKKGAGVCRNIALSKAKGKWILFADADDYFLDDFFIVLLKYIESNADIVYFPPISIDESSGELSYRHIAYANMCKQYKYNHGINNELHIKYDWNSPCSKLIKRELIIRHNIRFDEVSVSNDVMFSMKTAYYASNIEVGMEEIYCITLGKDTLTTKKDKRNLEIRTRIFIDRYNFLKGHLSRWELDYLDINGKNLILMAWADGYGFIEAINIAWMLRKGGVRSWKIKYLKSDMEKLIKRIK